MRRFFCCLGLVALAGCDSAPQMHSRSDIRDIASEASAADNAELLSRIEALELRANETEKALAGVRDLGIENADNANALAELVSKNAKVSNDNAVADMTRRAACGTETVRLASGGIQNRVIPCTVKDLRE